MAPIDRRVRLWAWMVGRQGSIASRSEAEVIALQARRIPDNALTNRMLVTFSAADGNQEPLAALAAAIAPP